jgi:hypothetical protein
MALQHFSRRIRLPVSINSLVPFTSKHIPTAPASRLKSHNLYSYSLG